MNLSNFLVGMIIGALLVLAVRAERTRRDLRALGKLKTKLDQLDPEPNDRAESPRSNP